MIRTSFVRNGFRIASRIAGIRWMAAIVLTVLFVSHPHPLCAADLSPEEVQVLEVMDERFAAQAVSIAAQVAGWQQKLAQAKDAAGAIDGNEDPQPLVDVVMDVAGQIKKIVLDNPSLAKYVDYEFQIGAILKKADVAWRSAPFDPKKTPEVDEKAFRQKLKQQALAVASQELRGVLESTVFKKIEMLRNPAEFAKSFLDTQFREWTQKSLPLDDEKTIMARILPPPNGISIFSPQANLGLEIEYMPQDLVVKGTGLWFKYIPGQALPRPVIDDIKIQLDPKQTALNKVKALGDELIAGLDLPIKISLKGNPNLMPGAGGKRGGIPFDVEIGLLEAGVVKVTAKDLMLYPGNKVDWKGSELKTTVPLTTPVPLGTTPFGMWTIEASLAPAEKRIGIGTKISTIASPPEIIALDVKLKTSIPVKELELDGSLIVATMAMMQTVGKVNFETGTIEGTFKAGSGSPLGALIMADGSFSLKRERFITDGKMKLVGKDFSDMHTEINFQDGSAVLSATSGFELFGTNFASSLNGEVTPGFKSLRLEAVNSVGVKLEPYGAVDVTVIVTVDSTKEDPVNVVVKTFDKNLDISFDLPSFNECTLAELNRRLKDNGVKAYHQLLKKLAEGDEATRKLGAQMDQKTRKWASDKFGGAWKTNNPELDAIGSRLSTEWKEVGGAWHELTQNVGGVASQAGQTILEGGGKVVEPITNVLSGKPPF